jgi:nicotinamide-nucleotide amidase
MSEADPLDGSGARSIEDSLFDPQVTALARRVVEENRAAGRKIVVAESCTGGLVAAAITEISGSSDVFDRGFVTYSNESKHDCLGVSEDLLDAFGAVSIACVYAMAQGALERSDADIAVAISGIAGPTGGSEQKPVGTVVFARVMRGDEKPEAESRRLGDKDGSWTRAEIRRQATLCALELLLP